MSTSKVNRAAILAANRRRCTWKIKGEKTAEWMVIDERHGECSNCGYVQETNGIDKTGHACILYGVYRVCNGCGAHMMRGEEK